ncbi:MAG: flagellar protein FlaG [Caldimicrobium sp.]|nr:flagellar protein FlaG [Caldimicrobium sp.]MCX7613733.1 flagellar protein FlaG [Caldimicrobium sp.]MDW8183168.1 flagellar protein FlaG [Caldimicrobium sp.]
MNDLRVLSSLELLFENIAKATSKRPKINSQSKPSSFVLRPAEKSEVSGSLNDVTSTKPNFFINLEKINQVLLSINKALEIEIDKDLQYPIYKIIDTTTKEVLRQIPLKDIVDFKRALYEFLKEVSKEKDTPLKGIVLEKEV